MTFDEFFALAQSQVKTDGDDDALLTQHAQSAVEVAAGFCRRNLYWQQTDLDTAQATYLTLITNAENAWATCKTTYAPPCDWDYWDLYYFDPPPPTTQDYINARMLMAGRKTYIAAITAANRINDGILIDNAIIAALLLIVGHLYRNRNEVISQAGAVAIQLPMGAQRILEPKMAV